MELLSTTTCFGGTVSICKHAAKTTSCDMKFAVFSPPQAKHGPVPVLWYLSGLTCTEENFTVKAGAQRVAAELGIMLVAPDTSPRGEDVANDDAYDLGQGAGFYVDATQEPWSPHFRMYSYITDELPKVIAANFPADMTRQGITGHSMGGHGALTLWLRNPGIYRSVSAFSPIVAPTQVPWGQKALTAYLGSDRSTWAAHDATALMLAGGEKAATDRPDVLIDQGLDDNFLAEQLKTHLFEDACKQVGQKATIRMQPGYDHSYFFIATFIEDHLRHHAKILCA